MKVKAGYLRVLKIAFVISHLIFKLSTPLGLLCSTSVLQDANDDDKRAIIRVLICSALSCNLKSSSRGGAFCQDLHFLKRQTIYEENRGLVDDDRSKTLGWSYVFCIKFSGLFTDFF